MRKPPSILTAFLTFSCVLALPTARGQMVTIPATSNIYSSGHTTLQSTCSSSIGAGTLPVPINLPPNAVFVEFHAVTGTVLYCSSCGPANNADGNTTSSFTFDPLAGISGLTSTARGRFFEGVFLTAAEPADPAPPALTFTDYAFASLAPQVAQHFYIGDGLTGTGSGSVQRFYIPAGATRLFLGFSDGFTPCIGAYDDNTGSITATVAIFPCSPADLGQQGGIPGPDGVLDNNDFIVYINYFFDGDPRADFGQQGGIPGSDGAFDNNDFVVFIDRFFTGC